jgi:copper chaperone
MDELQFHVPGMTCGHCESAVKTEIGMIAGVRSVAVDLATKMVTVTGESLTEDAIIAAIDEAGFEVTAPA